MIYVLLIVLCPLEGPATECEMLSDEWGPHKSIERCAARHQQLVRDLPGLMFAMGLRTGTFSWSLDARCVKGERSA